MLYMNANALFVNFKNNFQESTPKIFLYATNHNVSIFDLVSDFSQMDFTTGICLGSSNGSQNQCQCQ